MNTLSLLHGTWDHSWPGMELVSLGLADRKFKYWATSEGIFWLLMWIYPSLPKKVLLSMKTFAVFLQEWEDGRIRAHKDFSRNCLSLSLLCQDSRSECLNLMPNQNSFQGMLKVNQNLIFVDWHMTSANFQSSQPLQGYMFDYDLEAFHDHSVVLCWECSFLG